MFSFIFNKIRGKRAKARTQRRIRRDGRELAGSKVDMSNTPTSETSWIERTIRVCDQVLTQAAHAHPANLILRNVPQPVNVSSSLDPRSSIGSRKILAS